MSLSRPLIAIDLCSGAGGWACAARGLPIRIELAVDLWPAACRTYELNHPQTDVLCGDLRLADVQEQVLVRASDPGRVDLVLGGIPCEWLSCYRRLVKVGRAELAEQRATLDAVLGLIKRIDPPFWCLEDVPQLAGELPILTPYTILNARDYSAQRRKRVYAGCFPHPPPGRNRQVLADKLRPGPWRVGSRLFGREPCLNRIVARRCTLAAHPQRKAPTVLTASSRRDAEVGLVDPRLPGGLRQLEWQEMAALQGFPEDYLFYGSPGDVAKMVGRAVQIDTARAILEAIVKAAAKAERRDLQMQEVAK